jgi:hypothetical protein
MRPRYELGFSFFFAGTRNEMVCDSRSPFEFSRNRVRGSCMPFGKSFHWRRRCRSKREGKYQRRGAILPEPTFWVTSGDWTVRITIWSYAVGSMPRLIELPCYLGLSSCSPMIRLTACPPLNSTGYKLPFHEQAATAIPHDRIFRILVRRESPLIAFVRFSRKKGRRRIIFRSKRAGTRHATALKPN